MAAKWIPITSRRRAHEARSSTHTATASTAQSFKRQLKCMEAAKTRLEQTRALARTHTGTISTHVRSNYSERTLPERRAPSDLVPGQIDEALYRLSRSNNSYLALITRTREDLQVLDLGSSACLHTVLPRCGCRCSFLNLNKQEHRLLKPFFFFFIKYSMCWCLLKKVACLCEEVIG